MKKIFMSLLYLSALSLQGQTIEDAYRWSQTSYAGSARYVAMGGAFGAVGGDFSAFTANPAGSSVFAFSEVGFSLDYSSFENSTLYNNNRSTNEENLLHFPQGGIVLVLDNTTNGDWSKVAIGLNIERAHNYRQTHAVSGYNQGGIDQYFLDYAQGRFLGDISILSGENFQEAYRDIGERQGLGYPGQQALFGYEGFIVNPIPLADNDDPTHPDIVDYRSNTASGENGYRHALFNTHKGGINKFTLNVSSVFQKKLFIGLNIHTYRLRFQQQHNFFEDGYSSDSGVRETNFYNRLETNGSGSSFQLGAIYKLSNALRLGVSLQSPTYYQLNDRIRQVLTVDLNDENNTNVRLDPETETVFPDYDFQTPGHLRGSMAYVFKDKGLISIDYTSKNYSQMQFTPADDLFFQSLNQTLNNQFGRTQTWQVGGEFRLNPLFSLRGGFIHESSPVALEENLETTIFSTGVGLNFGPSTVDIAVVNAQRTNNYRMYDRGLTTPYTLDKKQFSLQITYRLKL